MAGSVGAITLMARRVGGGTHAARCAIAGWCGATRARREPLAVNPRQDEGAVLVDGQEQSRLDGQVALVVPVLTPAEVAAMAVIVAVAADNSVCALRHWPHAGRRSRGRGLP